MHTDNNSQINNGAHYERDLREKFNRFVEKVTPPVGIWGKILDKVKQARETGEWPEDLDEEESHRPGDSVSLFKCTRVVWSRNGERSHRWADVR